MSPSTTDLLDISTIERDTGISKETLRVWERRYGYPNPIRGENGERLFGPDHLRKLQLVRRLLDQGHRPGSVVPLPVQELERLAAKYGAQTTDATASSAKRSKALNILKLLEPETIGNFQAELVQVLRSDGLERFVCETVVNLNQLVGQAWMSGELQIFQEHVYTESLQSVLRNAIQDIPASGGSLRVLLATPPNELHGLGLLMAEAMLKLNNCRCLSLGTQVPINEIVLAQSSYQAHVIGLSVSGALKSNHAFKIISDLREQVNDSVHIWIGGQSDLRKKKMPAATRHFPQLGEIGVALEQLRGSQDGT